MPRDVKRKSDSYPERARSDRHPCDCGCGEEVVVRIELEDGHSLSRHPGRAGAIYATPTCAQRARRALRRAASGE